MSQTIASIQMEKDPEKSERQVEREIAEELDRSPATIHTAVQREKKRLVSLTPPDLTDDDKKAILSAAKNIKLEKTTRREKIEAIKDTPADEVDGTYDVITGILLAASTPFPRLWLCRTLTRRERKTRTVFCMWDPKRKRPRTNHRLNRTDSRFKVHTKPLTKGRTSILEPLKKLFFEGLR